MGFSLYLLHYMICPKAWKVYLCVYTKVVQYIMYIPKKLYGYLIICKRKPKPPQKCDVVDGVVVPQKCLMNEGSATAFEQVG